MKNTIIFLVTVLFTISLAFLYKPQERITTNLQTRANEVLSERDKISKASFNNPQVAGAYDEVQDLVENETMRENTRQNLFASEIATTLTSENIATSEAETGSFYQAEKCLFEGGRIVNAENSICQSNEKNLGQIADLAGNFICCQKVN